MLLDAMPVLEYGTVLRLDFALPYSNGEYAETILVPSRFIANKLVYIEQMYNEDLEMKNNPAVKILNFSFVLPYKLS